MDWGAGEFLCQSVITRTLHDVQDIWNQDYTTKGCREEFFATARIRDFI